MNNPLSELYDIEGLDAVSCWPLGPGWWVILGLSVLIISGVSLYLYRKRALKRKWQYGLLSQLSMIQDTLTPATSQAALVELSQLIRRIAMHKYSRSECAGLEGSRWLIWLKVHDPVHFDWESKGIALIEAPYAPFYEGIPSEDILELIRAIRRWIK